MDAKARIRCWGNYLGIVLPKALVDEEELKEGEEVEITIRKVSDVRSTSREIPLQEPAK